MFDLNASHTGTAERMPMTAGSIGRVRRRLLLLILVAAAMLAGTPAWADTATATPINSVPYSDSIDFSTASADTDATDCTYGMATVWYTYTSPSDQALVANASTTTHSHVSILTGSPGSLTALVCDAHPPARIEVASGQTVYLAVVDIDGSGGSDTFTLEVAPPPFEVAVTLDGLAKLGSAPGTAIVSGTATCNTDAEIYISGNLRQKQGLNLVRGEFGVYSPCSSDPISWTTSVDGGSRVFLTKSATLIGTASGCDRFQFTCDSDSATRTVKIVRK